MVVDEVTELREWIKRAKFDELDEEEEYSVSKEVRDRYELLKREGLLTEENYEKMWEISDEEE